MSKAWSLTHAIEARSHAAHKRPELFAELASGGYELARHDESSRPDLAKYGARATERAGEATTSELAPR